jgi:hypothetical protein
MGVRSRASASRDPPSTRSRRGSRRSAEHLDSSRRAAAAVGSRVAKVVLANRGGLARWPAISVAEAPNDL